MPKFNPSAILKQIRNKKDTNNNSNKNSDSEREQYEYNHSQFNSNPINNSNVSYSPQTQTTTEKTFRPTTPPPTFFVQNSEYLSRLNNEKYESVNNPKTENHTPTFTQTSTHSHSHSQSQTPIPNLSFLNTTYTPPEPLYQMPSHNNPLPNPYSVVDLLKDQLEEKLSENRHLSNLVVEAELHIKTLQDQKIALEGALRDAMLQIQSLDQRCRGLAEQRNDLLKELGNRGRDSLEKRLAEVERRVSPTPSPNYEISPTLRRIPSNRASSSMSYPPNNNNDTNHNKYDNNDNNNNNNNNNINSFHPPLTVPDFDKRKPAFVPTISPHSTRFQHKQEMGVIHLPRGLKESEKPVIRIDLASEIKSMYHNNNNSNYSNNSNNNNNYTNQNNTNPHFENGRGRPPSRTKQRPIK